MDRQKDNAETDVKVTAAISDLSAIDFPVIVARDTSDEKGPYNGDRDRFMTMGVNAAQ
jgi:hypothetical protein